MGCQPIFSHQGRRFHGSNMFCSGLGHPRPFAAHLQQPLPAFVKDQLRSSWFNFRLLSHEVFLATLCLDLAQTSDRAEQNQERSACHCPTLCLPSCFRITIHFHEATALQRELCPSPCGRSWISSSHLSRLANALL